MTTSPPENEANSAIIWQGFHHAWEYNHRLNRFGSYVRHVTRPSGARRAVIGHTAASGTGNDTAQFREFVTEIRSAQGVAFQSGYAETRVECQRGDLTSFVIKVDGLELKPQLQHRDVYTVVLNGFDIYAKQHSEKIMTFDVEVSDVTLSADKTKGRFFIVGNLRFDCRSSECQLLPWRLESEPVDAGSEEDESLTDARTTPMPEPHPKRGLDRRRFDRAAHWLKRALTDLTGVDEVKASIVGEGGDTGLRKLFRVKGRRYFIRFLKWRFSAPYIVRFHYLIVAGDERALTVTESDDIELAYRWNMEEEIRFQEVGTTPVTLAGDDPAKYQVNTPAFRRLLLDVMIDEEEGSEDPIQWGQGMHMLEWHHAVRNPQPTSGGLEAILDLFYKSWSEAMNEVITLTTWGAVRAAGSARLGARLALLQFTEADEGRQRILPGRIYWPGRGLSARRDPRARFEYQLDLSPATEGETDAGSA